MTSKAGILDGGSKSLPPSEFPVVNISSADSGIDSDASPSSSTKLSSFLEDIETDVILPQSFLLGPNAPEKERIKGINKAIDWIKDELVKMKLKDKQLMKTMITVRSKIAEQKMQLERLDTGYDSDSETRKQPSDAYLRERWKLIAKDGAFPADSKSFDSNKRATWAI